jgi:hypothetical protein
MPRPVVALLLLLGLLLLGLLLLLHKLQVLLSG